MTLALTVLLRVVRRRVSKGESLDTVLADYPRLTQEERAQIESALVG